MGEELRDVSGVRAVCDGRCLVAGYSHVGRRRPGAGCGSLLAGLAEHADEGCQPGAQRVPLAGCHHRDEPVVSIVEGVAHAGVRRTSACGEPQPVVAAIVWMTLALEQPRGFPRRKRRAICSMFC